LSFYKPLRAPYFLSRNIDKATYLQICKWILLLNHSYQDENVVVEHPRDSDLEAKDNGELTITLL
jgi:hypothetical protein